jgi:hypothetical protein
MTGLLAEWAAADMLAGVACGVAAIVAFCRWRHPNTSALLRLTAVFELVSAALALVTGDWIRAIIAASIVLAALALRPRWARAVAESARDETRR